MSLNVRRLLLIAVGFLSLVGVACSSNNKGKIVGKWKALAMPGLDSNEFKKLDEVKTTIYFEFRADNSMIRGYEFGNPLIESEFVKSGQPKTVAWKYKLLSGDLVEFYDMPKDMQEKSGAGVLGRNKDRARTRIKISGDNMTWVDDDGKNASFVRVK